MQRKSVELTQQNGTIVSLKGFLIKILYNRIHFKFVLGDSKEKQKGLSFLGLKGEIHVLSMGKGGVRVSYQCRFVEKDCDGCGDCQDETELCPNCGSLGYEARYFLGNEWIGCDECMDRRYI